MILIDLIWFNVSYSTVLSCASAFLKYGFGSLSLLQWALEVSSFHSNIKTSVTFCSLVFSKVYFGVCSLYSTQKCSLEFAAEVPDRQKQIGAEMTTQPSFKSDIKEFAGCKSVPFSSLLFYFSVIKYAVYLVSWDELLNLFIILILSF